MDLKAEHINQYIRASSGMGFTAKISEPGSYCCAERLAFLAVPQTEAVMKAWKRRVPSVESMDKLWSEGDWEVPTTDTGRNKAMLAVIDTVAANLGNTRTVCRSSYIHPWFLDAWTDGRLDEAWAEFADMRAMGNMTPGESTTLRILKSVVKA